MPRHEHKLDDVVLHEAHIDSDATSETRRSHRTTIEGLDEKDGRPLYDLECGKWAYEGQVRSPKERAQDWRY